MQQQQRKCVNHAQRQKWCRGEELLPLLSIFSVREEEEEEDMNEGEEENENIVCVFVYSSP